MAEILKFPEGKAEPANNKQTSVRGLIQIRSTEDGDEISVEGAYADRLQYGAYMALKLLNMFADKIAAADGNGYSRSEPIEAILPAKKQPRRNT